MIEILWQTLTAHTIGFDVYRRLGCGVIAARPQAKRAYSARLILAIVTLSSKAAKRMTPLMNSFKYMLISAWFRPL